MTNPRTTKTLQLYGAAISSGDSCGCQDYTKAIELRGVTLVDDDYLATLQVRIVALEQQLASRGGVPSVEALRLFLLNMEGSNHYPVTQMAEEIVGWMHRMQGAPSPEGQNESCKNCLGVDVSSCAVHKPEGQEAEQTYKHWCIELVAALKALSFAAQTTGGTAGRDEPLCVAIEQAERAMSYAAASRAIDAARPTPAEGQAGELRETLKRAYWDFDARRKGYAPYGVPYGSEESAFIVAVQAALASQPAGDEVLVPRKLIQQLFQPMPTPGGDMNEYINAAAQRQRAVSRARRQLAALAAQQQEKGNE